MSVCACVSVRYIHKPGVPGGEAYDERDLPILFWQVAFLIC